MRPRASRAERDVRRRRRRARGACAADGRALAAGRAAAARIRGRRLLPLRPSARRLCAGAQKLRVQSWAEFAQRGEGGRHGRPGRRHRRVAHRAPDPTGNKMGIIGLSDPTGHYEAVIFSEGLAAVSRPAGARRRRAAVPVGAKCRATTCAPASSRPSRWMPRPPSCTKGLRVFLRDDRRRSRGEALGQSGSRRGRLRRSRATANGDGEVTVVLHARPAGEVEVEAARPLQGLAADRRRASRPCPAWCKSRRWKARFVTLQPVLCLALPESQPI